ncbi:hypothetical protein DSECCO2_86030 [anaerobic digester metagenome]
MQKKGKSLWMRAANFKVIRNFIYRVYHSNGQYSSSELDSISIKEGIFKKENGLPFSRSTCFFYRKICENLELIQKINGKYYINESLKNHDFFNNVNSDNPLSKSEKKFFSEIILLNEECFNFFFSIFIKQKPKSASEFQKDAVFCRVVVKTQQKNDVNLFFDPKRKKTRIDPEREITFISEYYSCSLLGKNDINAIFYGIRKWAIDLEILEEFIYDKKDERYLYPIYHAGSNLLIKQKIFEIIQLNENNCVILHIPTLIKEIALETRYPIVIIKHFLLGLRKDYPKWVSFIPSSTVLMHERTIRAKNFGPTYDLYLYTKERGYISHIRIFKDIINEVNYDQYL